MIKRVFFDLETTGVHFWRHGIHELAGCIEIDGKVEEEFNWYMKPDPRAVVEVEALAIAGKTLADLEDYPNMGFIYKLVVDMLGKYVNKFDKKDKFFLVGFNNAAFDNPFFRAWFKQNEDNYFGSWFWPNPIDVYVLASEKLMDVRPEMENFKLATVCRKVGIEVDDSRLHEAQYDIYLTRQLYYAVR